MLNKIKRGRRWSGGGGSAREGGGGGTEVEKQKKETVSERLEVRHPDESQSAVRALVCEENIK